MEFSQFGLIFIGPLFRAVATDSIKRENKKALQSWEICSASYYVVTFLTSVTTDTVVELTTWYLVAPYDLSNQQATGADQRVNRRKPIKS
jgi:hypothetical protein